QLDREVLVRRGSDILGPFVGQSESNLAKAFEEAEREDAVLVIDEVDSLLGARANARCSWEVSLVNEFLASMERFHGIMLATTNCLPDLDPASLRRFTWKARFGHLRGEACMALYQATLAPLVGQPVGPEEMATLVGMGGLTPGDFAVVRDRLALQGGRKPTHGQYLEALAVELKVKVAASGKPAIGFII
ncbi:MAG: ATP-binding protein, partial [Syntrophales bacterium LBB04]|nr:ATP-binding protein [Syntrophales bacterium LBB04]